MRRPEPTDEALRRADWKRRTLAEALGIAAVVRKPVRR